MSLSGKNDIDWSEVRIALGDIPATDKAPLVKRKSRDFFWYSPLLKEKLGQCCGDLLVQPRDQADLVRILALAYARRLPVTLRGGGTGNYGQCVPLDGGLIVETTDLERILEIGPDWVRVEAGCNIYKLNQALRAQGRELPVFPSTERMATIGGFVGGGSGGTGSIEHGMLRDQGNIVSLTVLTVEAAPQVHVLTGDDINLVHHAWGINGVITELTLKTAPARDWINCIAAFADYGGAFTAGKALGARDDIKRKLVSSVDAGITAYFSKLQDRLGDKRHLLLALIAREDLAAYRAVMETADGRVALTLDEEEMVAAEIPPVFEFAYNHTTLQVLKADRNVTYLQVTVPHPIDVDKVITLREILGPEVMMHHEFAKLAGRLVAYDLPVLRYRDKARLYEIIRIYEDNGFPVSDPHTYIIEDGGMKSADYRHLATKKRFDPLGLLNSGKSRSWQVVKDLAPEAIEALEKAPEGNAS